MIMAVERATPLCATIDCPRDAVMYDGTQPRWCVRCAPRSRPEPCGAVDQVDDVARTCLDPDTLHFKPAGYDWIHRCRRHRTTDRMRVEFPDGR